MMLTLSARSVPSASSQHSVARRSSSSASLFRAARVSSRTPSTERAHKCTAGVMLAKTTRKGRHRQTPTGNLLFRFLTPKHATTVTIIRWSRHSVREPHFPGSSHAIKCPLHSLFKARLYDARAARLVDISSPQSSCAQNASLIKREGARTTAAAVQNFGRGLYGTFFDCELACHMHRISFAIREQAFRNPLPSSTC